MRLLEEHRHRQRWFLTAERHNSLAIFPEPIWTGRSSSAKTQEERKLPRWRAALMVLRKLFCTWQDLQG